MFPSQRDVDGQILQLRLSLKPDQQSQVERQSCWIGQRKVMESQKFELNFDSARRHPLIQRSSGQRLLVAAIAAIGAVGAEATVFSVQAASLTQWNFDPAANQLEITVKDGTTPRYFLMAQPARIVLDLPGTAVGDVSAQQTYDGAVRQIRVSQFEPGLTRIVMEISPGVSLAPGQVKLQKVGGEAASSGNSRWVLQPLITKSLSINAVKPSASPLPRLAATAPAASTPAARAPKPLAIKPSNPSSASASSKPSASAPSKLTRAETPIPLPQMAVTGNNASSKPVDTAIPPISGSQLADARSDRPPTVGIPDLATAKTPAPATSTPTASTPATAEPSKPAALAPVLSSTSTASPTITPLPPPPSTATPSDSSVAVDTQTGVAIAVPAPGAVSTDDQTVVTQKPQVALAAPSPGSLPTAAGGALQPPAATSQPAPSQPPVLTRVEPSHVARSRSTANPTAPTAAIASRAATPSIAQPSAPAFSIAAAEIPTTLAAASTALPPSVSVPPLNAASAPTEAFNPSGTQIGNASVQQPAASFDMPSASLPTIGTQPSVRVPPPIQVGTPSLGTAGTPSAAEAAPMSVFAPNVPIEPPVSVPPLQPIPPLQPSETATAVPIKPAQASYDANTVRQSTSSTDLAPPLNLAPLQAPTPQPNAPLSAVAPGYNADTIRQAPSEAAPSTVVEFGQPLPAKGSTVRPSQPLNGLTASQGVRQAFKPSAPDVLLPAGTVLNLRYPGDATLLLQSDRPQQEVLVLLTELRDASGNLLAPAGSAVTGRFETTTNGSQFVTQAIAVSGRTIPLMAQSDTLDGSRKVQGNNLAVNSGIGLVAGGVLGAVSGSAGLGVLGGAAAGAAATLLTAPKPAAIQPGQVVQVRLTQDLRSFE